MKVALVISDAMTGEVEKKDFIVTAAVKKCFDVIGDYVRRQVTKDGDAPETAKLLVFQDAFK
jgi:hypothetical protein